jgi:hypothetical protein
MGDLILIIIAAFALLCLFSNSMNENFEDNNQYFLPSEGISFNEDGNCGPNQKLYTDTFCKINGINGKEVITQNFCVNSNTCGIIMHQDKCDDVSASMINNCSKGYTKSWNTNHTTCTCKLN